MGFLLALSAAALLAACSTTPAPQVRTDQDPSADLKTYRTFSFYETPPNVTTSIVAQRFEHAARQQLESRGYVYDPADPDLRVGWRLQVAERVEVHSTPGRGVRGWNAVETSTYRQGALRIDLVDARRHAMVWQGIAEGRIDPHDEGPASAAVEAAVSGIFASFPGAK
jgi:hypothetical protein